MANRQYSVLEENIDVQYAFLDAWRAGLTAMDRSLEAQKAAVDAWQASFIAWEQYLHSFEKGWVATENMVPAFFPRPPTGSQARTQTGESRTASVEDTRLQEVERRQERLERKLDEILSELSS